MNQVYLNVYRLFDDVNLPTYGTRGAACMDIRAYFRSELKLNYYDSYNEKRVAKVIDDGETARVEIPAGARMMVPTGLIFDIPVGYSVRFHPRSGLSLKSVLVLANMEGVVDYDFVDPSQILVWNASNSTYLLEHGERIAQAELVKDIPVELVEIASPPQQKTDRNGGFGSSGVK